MTAQEQGMCAISQIVRQLTPPALDFVVLIYKPDGEVKMSSIGCSRHGKTDRQQYERMREAAQEFLGRKPDAQFAAEQN